MRVCSHARRQGPNVFNADAIAAEIIKRCTRRGLFRVPSQLQKPFVGQAAQERADISQNFLARCGVALRQLFASSSTSSAGKAFGSIVCDRVGFCNAA
jgi:hypothetical protein